MEDSYADALIDLLGKIPKALLPGAVEEWIVSRLEERARRSGGLEIPETDKAGVNKHAIRLRKASNRVRFVAFMKIAAFWTVVYLADKYARFLPRLEWINAILRFTGFAEDGQDSAMPAWAVLLLSISGFIGILFVVELVTGWTLFYVFEVWNELPNRRQLTIVILTALSVAAVVFLVIVVHG